MRNPPAFQFYPQDFLSDLNVQSMTDDEVGKYIKLLCYCWIEDGLGIGSPLVGKWLKDAPTVARCFVKKGGKYRNPRLDRERDKQRRWSEKSSTGGLHSAENKKTSKGGSTKCQPNANQGPTLLSSSSISNKEKNKSYCPLADFLRDRVRANVPFQKISENYRESWAKEFRLMVEDDKIPIERVKAVLDWATADSFWKTNIRSASKFREKFGELEAKSRLTNAPAASDRSKRVGSTRPTFAESLTVKQKELLPDIDKEYEAKFEADPMGAPPRDVFRARRLAEIERS